MTLDMKAVAAYCQQDVNSMYASIIDIKSIEQEKYRMRVLNKKYWPHQVEVKNTQDSERWCYEHFNSGNWRNVGRVFAFKRSEDVTYFLLCNEQ